MALRYHTVVTAHRLRAVLTAALIGAAPSCSDDQAPPPGTQSSPPDTPGDIDGGLSTNLPPVRPVGAPILPAADDEVTLPYGAGPTHYTIEVEADPGVLDVHFSVDTTGSIDAEIDELQREMARTIAPGLRKRVESVSFGVSRFADFPHPPFGSAGNSRTPADTPFALLTPLTSSLTRVTSALAHLDQPLDHGGDLPEAGAEALWQIATGAGYQTEGAWLIAPYSEHAEEGGGTAGGVGFRAKALRVVLHVTDAPSHSPAEYSELFPGTHDMLEASSALSAIQARVVSIVSGACSGTSSNDADCARALYARTRSELERVALFTGAVGQPPDHDQCPHGIASAPVPASDGTCPLVFDVDERGHGLSDAILDSIVDLLDGIRFGVVTGRVEADPIGFILAVSPAPAGDTVEAAKTADLYPEDEPDGVPDSYVEVRSKMPLLFQVTLQNDSIRSSDVDQLFRVMVQVEGDGVILEQRTLRIRVPKGPSLAPDLDAGAVEDAG
jgi:hypothetical protein